MTTTKRRVRTAATFDARKLLERFDPDTPATIIAARLGTNRGNVHRWLRGDSVNLSPYAADRYAVRIGLHPCAVWGEAWWEAALAPCRERRPRLNRG